MSPLEEVSSPERAVSPPDNALDYLDESFFLDFRAEGHGPVIQFTWIYEHDVDIDALRRFHRNLGKSLMGRRIERSPIPFCRARWVAWPGPEDIDIAGDVRARADVTSWTYEQAARPIDPEAGPSWRMAVQPLSGGGAAVTLLAAHAVIDGVGMLIAVADAVNGAIRDLGYPAPRSRTKMQAWLRDSRAVLRDLPRVAQALVTVPFAARSLQDHVRPRAGRTAAFARSGSKQSTLARRDPAVNRMITIPSVMIYVDIDHWDERAQALGGTSNSLFLGLASRLCDAVRWVDEDGMANFTIPVNQREPGDTRGNALTGLQLTLDPSPSVASDLRGVRAALKAALSTLGETRTKLEAPLPLIPFVPAFASHRFQAVLLNSANLTCSNVGDIDPAVNSPDGTEAQHFSGRFMRLAGQLTGSRVSEAGGLFFPVATGRIAGEVFISISYVDRDGSTTAEGLTDIIGSVLNEFGVTASVE